MGRPTQEMFTGGEAVDRLGGIAHFVLLCGMFARHYSDEETAQGIVSRYGVGVMVRSHEIQAALMADNVRAERLRWDAELVNFTKRIDKINVDFTPKVQKGSSQKKSKALRNIRPRFQKDPNERFHHPTKESQQE